MHEADSELIARCLQGDDRAWHALVQRYSRLVYAVPSRQGLAADVCDDVYQGVFVLLLRSLGSLRDHGTLAKWLIVAARNECSRVRASRGRERVLIAEGAPRAPAESPQAELERLERRQRVWAAVDRLDPRCRELLFALFASGERPDYELVSRRLGIPVGSIGPSRARCLSRLVEFLRERDSV